MTYLTLYSKRTYGPEHLAGSTSSYAQDDKPSLDDAAAAAAAVAARGSLKQDLVSHVQSRPASAEIQHVEAPLSLVCKSGDIAGHFLLDLSTNTTAQPARDLLILTNNGSIDLSIALGGQVDRPAMISANSKNGPVRLRVPGSSTGQSWNITAFADDGTLHVGLPSTFDGIVTVDNLNGGVELTPALKRNSTVVNSTFTQNLWSNTTQAKYSIKPGRASGTGDKKPEVRARTVSAGKDIANFSNKNGRLVIGYHDDALDYPSSTSWELCVTA